MPRRKPPVRFQSCCPSFGYLADHGLVQAHTVTYKAPDFVQVEVLIGFITTATYLHLRRKQHLFECPFCGAALQGVVKVTVRDMGLQYGGEAPIRLGENPKTGPAAAFTHSQLEEAFVKKLARSNAVRLSWVRRRTAGAT